MMLRKRPSIFLLASALVGLAVVATPAAHATTITIVNLDGPGEGFNDATAAAPVGGNPGTTIGAQRLNVFTHAASVWAGLISSSVEIRVGANFDPLTPCDAFSGVLGSAGPNTAHRNFTGALVANTWYPAALANALNGSDLAPVDDDIGAQFNSNVGTAGCLPSNPWYYGLDGLGPAGSIDLATVVLHELGHGLGFLTFVDLATGAKFLSGNDTFMLNLERHGATPADYPSMTNAQRVAASTDTGNLHWVGPNVEAASGTLTAGTVGTHVRMYAPSPQEVGSSVSHWDTALTPDQLLEPFFTHHFAAPILELPLFQDIGWTLAAVPAPNISVTPGSFNFGSVFVGNTGGPKDFTVTNTGTATLHVASTSIVGTDSTQFSITNGVNAFNLAPSATQTVSVSFHPTGANGGRSATLRFVSDDPDTPTKDVALSGTAVVPTDDLALVKITAPKTVTVAAGVPVTKPVKVQFQNRSNHSEVLTDATVLGDGTTSGLVRLTVTKTDTNESCHTAVVALDAAKNAGLFKNGPKTVKSKAKVTINYLVTYQCDTPLKKNVSDASPGDYSYTATVFHSVLGSPDGHPVDDTCPHDALATPGHIDPNPDGKIVDKGCGAKKPDKTFGDPILTSVVAK